MGKLAALVCTNSASFVKCPARRSRCCRRRGIAVEALALVDEEGIEALTTRRLAKRLGVEGPSLYNHVSGRDDLLDEMTALIDEQVDTSLLDHPDWRVGLVEFARSYRRAFAAHPHIVATIASAAGATPTPRCARTTTASRPSRASAGTRTPPAS